LGVHIAVDVAAGKNDSDAFSGERVLFFQGSGKCCGACAFRKIVGVLIEGTHGGADGGVGDLDDAGDIFPNGFHGELVGFTAGEAVGDCGERRGFDYFVLGKAEGVGGGFGSNYTDDFGGETQSIAGR